MSALVILTSMEEQGRIYTIHTCRRQANLQQEEGRKVGSLLASPSTAGQVLGGVSDNEDRPGRLPRSHKKEDSLPSTFPRFLFSYPVKLDHELVARLPSLRDKVNNLLRQFLPHCQNIMPPTPTIALLGCW